MNNEILKKVVNKVYNAFDQEIIKDKFDFVVKNLESEFIKHNYSDQKLEKLYYELIENYKLYKPLCLASFITALKNISKPY